TDRANVGRSTFYAHFSSKDDLFMACHEAIVSGFQFGPLYSHPLSREEMLSPDIPPGMTSAFQHLGEARARLYPIFHSKDGPSNLRRIRDWSAQQIEANLRAAFADTDGNVPFDVLAKYLAGAQIALMEWWLAKDRSQTPESLASTFHSLQRAAIGAAFPLTTGEQISKS
ncbi:MAG TPA: TetR/AcrR family transcriptional regulator, partial [Promineifilum sp.]